MTHEEYAEHIFDFGVEIEEGYDKHAFEFISEMEKVTTAKNADYCAGTDDAMHDYHEAAKACEITPMKAWLVLFMKHVHAVQRYAKTGSVSSEEIHGRFIDLANYAMLGDALVNDMNKKKGKK